MLMQITRLLILKIFNDLNPTNFLDTIILLQASILQQPLLGFDEDLSEQLF